MLYNNGMHTNKEQLFFQVLQQAVNNGYRSEDVEKCECMTCVIFSHDFAKAFWGEEAWDVRDNTYAWKAHLKRMVLAEDPLQYLAKFL
jgi:hypothetical protein